MSVKSFNENEYKEMFVKEVTASIRDWMQNEYPDFDKTLSQKIIEIKTLQNEFKLLINDVKLDTRNQRSKDIELFKDEIGKFIKKQYPEISRSIVDTASKLKSKVKRLEEREETLDEALSASILKTIMNKMKKAFEDENLSS